MKPLRVLSCISLAAFAACGDPQTGSGYQGEPILQISGAIEGENITSDLVPAVVWYDPTYGDVYVQDIEVRGEFPNRFMLSLRKPVPPSMRLDGNFYIGPEVPGEFAVGSIAMVRRDHPIETYHGSSSVSDDAESSASDTTLGSGDEEWYPLKDCTCARDADSCEPDDENPARQLCDVDEDACYCHTKLCTDDDDVPCKSVDDGTGDPVAAHVPYWYAQGVALDYELVYVSREHPKGSLLSALLNRYQPLRRGVHLIHYYQPSAEEAAAREKCAAVATGQALDRFNAQYGTHWSSEEELGTADDEQWVSFHAYELEAFTESECPFQGTPFVEVVDKPRAAPLQIRIGPQVERQTLAIW